MKGLPPEIREYLTPSIKTGFEAAEEIQQMQNHWLYRFAESIHVNGEILYMMGQGVNKVWRAVTFRI
ncbi:MAG TPA: hypothetical protein VJB05_03505 [archaeon]|nr:hypothetical protein [archaeon]